MFSEVFPPGSRMSANAGSLPFARTCESPWWKHCLGRVMCRSCEQLAQMCSFSVKILLLKHLPAD